MWLPGAGVGGEDLTAKSAKGEKKRTHHEGTKDTKSSDIYTLKLRELRAFVVNIFFSSSSAGDFVGNIRRSFDPADGVALLVVTALQNFSGDAFGTEDYGYGARWAALFGVDVEGRDQIHFSGFSFGNACQFQFRIAFLAFIIDAAEALEAFRAVKHAVRGPGMGVVVNAALAAR